MRVANSSSLYIRFLMVMLWMTIFFTVLYIPHITRYFIPARTINIITFSGLIDPDYVREFEREHNVKINFSYFVQNEELLLKMYSTQGKGYDLVVVSEYVIHELIESKLLKPIEKNKLDFYDRIIPSLKDGYYDPGSAYSIPYYWGIYGLGFNKTQLPKVSDISWDLVFKDSGNYRTTNLDNPREAFLLAAFYLFGSIENIDSDQVAHVLSLLQKQKSWVEAYTEFLADYLLISQTVPIAVATTPGILRIANSYPYLDFMLPKEGSFQVVDAFVIPAASKQDDLVYKFLNFLYTKQSLLHHFKNYSFLPATIELKEFLQKYDRTGSVYAAHFENKIPLDYFRPTVPAGVIDKVWISLLAS